MTRRNKAQRNLKTDARMTPYDVKVKGTFAEPPKKVKLPPRKPTPEEQRANNLAPVEFSNSLGIASIIYVPGLSRMGFFNINLRER